MNKKLLTTAIGAVLISTVVGSVAHAQQSAKDIDKVVVTGSLIPQSQLETATPVTTISAEDIKARGFTSVADVLQQSSLSTGGVQGGQSSGGFTQGAETVSLFGLDPSYTKYLIDGRPMANYPALYNGSDTFNNISGIPVDLVERIEILPGGQSSLYGSDAIAGVVNIILKKQLDGSVLTLRGGTFTEGGGSSLRFSAAKGWSWADGRFNLLAGVQFEDRDPIWGYQRNLTKQYNRWGTGPQVAGRDYLVYSATKSRNTYYFQDPNNCANVDGLFEGSVGLRTRANQGTYCGSFNSPGYRSLRNGKESQQVYTHATYDVNDNLQLYSDVLYSHEEIDYFSGSNYLWWGTGSKWGAFYDPDLDDLVNLQRSFAPEEIGGKGFRDTMSKDKSRSYAVTFGGKGSFGESWDYDLSFTRNEYRLDERNFVRWADPVNDFFQNRVLGPQLGTESGFPIFRPDYAAFYSPITPDDFASFTGHTTNKSKTWDNMLRAQLTNASLFHLPGGDAGLAVVVEGGSQGWNYSPDAALIPDPETLESKVWGLTSVSGSGHRSRYAVTSELRLPLWEPLTVTVAGRYDAFKVGSETVDKPTYSIGIEYRPFESLLLRGKYGTAFRAPTLSDQFQGLSGYYSSVTDYYRCSLEGYQPGNTDDCGFDNEQYFGQQEGNPKLKPIEADVWNAGFVWSPLDRMSLSVDYFHWEIRDEVDVQSSDQLMLQEYFCRTGRADANSASCQQALAWVTRNAAGELQQIYTPKVNVSQQKLNALSANFEYGLGIGRFGSLLFRASYSNILDHTVKPLPGDPEIDLLRDPYGMYVYDAYAKTRADASVSWAVDKWNTTVYANRIGRTPNYQAYTLRNFEDEGTGWYAPYITYNLSVGYKPVENIELSVLVNNVLNKMPKEQAKSYPGTASEVYNSAVYDVYGRAVYLEMRYKFGAKN